MQPLISAKYYFDPDIFKQEQTDIFEKQWNFVGLTNEVCNHNDYLKINFGNISIVIHNFSGELKAFDNICTHRFCQIHADNSGNRPLQCPYHGWTFDQAGIPVGIPDAGSFECIDLKTRHAFKLKNWLLETCGSFIFVKKYDDGVTLEDYLGEGFSQILMFCKAIGKEVFKGSVNVDANWKVILENTLEGYHVNSIHKNTFGKFNIENPEFSYDQNHSYYQSASTDIDKKWQRIKKIFKDREINKDIYYHQLIFPNLTFGFSQGISFFIQVIRPATSKKTQISNYVFVACLTHDLSSPEKAIAEVLNDSISNFYQQVFLEDKQICEQIQKGVNSITTNNDDEYKGILSNHEQRIYAFHQAYLALMK
jgi:phenylpropionate dioxygenase-like ring-hydroxylating dioxygenase large terminal subunit